MELPAISAPALRHRAFGIMLGIACGEAAIKESGLTAMALELAESLAGSGDIEPELLLERWSRLDPGFRPPERSISGQALRLYQDGFPAQGLAEAVARIVPERSGDRPLVRALPIAIAARQDGARLKRWAEESALATHSDLSSRMATVASCLLTRDLLARGLAESLARVAQALREEAPLRLTRTLRLPRRGDLPEPGDDAVAVLSQAIHALAASSDLEGALQEAENQERPNPSVSALAGGMAGAAFGVEPGSKRLAGLEPGLRLRLESVAERLIELDATGSPAALYGDERD